VNTMDKNGLQKAIDQIGKDAVIKAIPMGSRIGMCDLHGAYMVHSSSELCCPICPATPPANGETPTEVEHYIDLKNLLDPASGTNPGQKINPYGV
jgi:hypothetical protein